MKLTLTTLKQLTDTPRWDWPRGTRPGLLRILRDPDAGERKRLLATGLAVHCGAGDDELASALLKVVCDAAASEELRGKAAIALGPVLEIADTDGFGAGDPDASAISERSLEEIQEALHALYLDAAVPQEVRRRVLEASVRAPRPWHEDALRAAYAAAEAGWKLTAVLGMRYVRGFDAEILEALAEGDVDIHAEALRAAGNWQLDEAWEHAVALIEDEAADRRLRLAAIEAVGQIRPDEAAEALADLEDSSDPDIEEAVAEALAMGGCDWDDDLAEGD